MCYRPSQTGGWLHSPWMPQMLCVALGTDVKPEWHTYKATEPGVVEENWTSACLTCGGGPQPSAEIIADMLIVPAWLHSNTSSKQSGLKELIQNVLMEVLSIKSLWICPPKITSSVPLECVDMNQQACPCLALYSLCSHSISVNVGPVVQQHWLSLEGKLVSVHLTAWDIPCFCHSAWGNNVKMSTSEIKTLLCGGRSWPYL